MIDCPACAMCAARHRSLVVFRNLDGTARCLLCLECTETMTAFGYPDIERMKATLVGIAGLVIDAHAHGSDDPAWMAQAMTILERFGEP